ncbi:MAG: succinate--CoA ligase subunit alpha [candidate division Zixibacteria bacterium]|nr:succinate--CoA ligase subunit alpha [candidate division Zixibacteria bacterium]MDH3938460.1 succinate--CoA ligase subunit alpha [candidate division Zixibacteria bacterium]MDH4033730.1 succinate--CoA ligase subunit alpha [candidate division Zixibacteria bacterium]
MAILVDNNSKVMVQGITGGAGKFHTERMLTYGTNIIGGATPSKGGQEVHGLPVFDTVAECVDNTGADVSVIFLPARFVKEAAIEAVRAGIKFLVIVPEHIPIHDMLHVRREAVAHGATIIGGNTAGIISPGQANLGIMPDIAFKPGRVGTVSRSGSITYYVADTLTQSGYGETTCVGLGGDPVLGSTFDEILLKFEEDDATKAVVMCGEIGGVYEERATQAIKQMKTPVLAMIGGVYAPPGKRMGHAGAIVEGKMGTAQDKLDALAEAGAHPCKTFTEIPKTLAKLGV